MLSPRHLNHNFTARLLPCVALVLASYVLCAPRPATVRQVGQLLRDLKFAGDNETRRMKAFRHEQSLLVKADVSDSSVESGYAVVIDCGSSGSRAHIYKKLITQDSATNENSVLIVPARDPNTNAVLTRRIRPGLASVRDNPSAASDYIKPLMDYVSANIPADEQAKTPVYIMATAGLRQITKEQQERILEDIAIDTRFDYNFVDIYTEVMSGSDEGINLWLSVNANANRLSRDFDHSERKFFCQAPRSRRYGVLEMGGASTQVTFEVSKILDDHLRFALRPHGEALEVYNRSIVRQVNLGLGASRRQVSLFSASFTGFGSDSVRDLQVDLLIKEKLKLERLVSHSDSASPLYTASSTMTLDDPCLPSGAEDSVEKSTEILTNESKTLGYPRSASNGDKLNVKLIGKGNFFLCRNLLHRMLLKAKEERLNCRGDQGNPTADCTSLLIATPFVPFKFTQFLGVGDFYYTTKEMINEAGRLNPSYVISKAVKICATPYATLLATYPEANLVDKERVLRECFKATWMLVWLHYGLKMPLAFSIDFTTVESLDGGETPLDWTLGALLRKIYDPPGESPFAFNP